MKRSIPYGRQNITDNDIEAVIDVLKSDYLTQGPVISEFEDAFAKYIGSNYAVAVSNGTAALHLSALSLNVSEGSHVITTPITFSATANCIQYCGGKVEFVDIDPETALIDLNKLEELLNSAPKGTFDGIIPVDFAGRPVYLERLKKLADEYGLWIIEDACHAPGGYFIDSEGEKQFCGNGNFADLAIFSFHPVKHIAAGEGGMITTNNVELYKKLLELRTHGITKDENQYINSPELAIGNTVDSKSPEQGYPGWYMEMQTLGYNYRLTDFQSALGMSQLARADAGIKRRREIAAKYANAFEGKKYIKRQAGLSEGHAYHLYVIEVENRFGLYQELRSKGIYSQIHYIPVHLMPYYKNLGWSRGDLPVSEEYYSNCISLPMYPTLEDEEQDYVIDCIDRFYE